MGWRSRVGRFGTRSLGAFVVLGASACATGAANAFEATHAAPALEHVVEVQNRNWDDMHIYATQGSAMFRLGSVPGNETRALRLPLAWAGRSGGMRLAARSRSGGEVHYSEVISLGPGQRLGWSLEPNLSLSFHWIR